MSRVERFEDLIAWQKARALTQTIYELTRAGNSAFDRGLASQMQRAAVSVMSNLAEGFERNSTRDFHRFVVIAKGSCAELRSQVYVAIDAGFVNHDQYQNLMGQCVELSRILGGLKSSLLRRAKEQDLAS